MGRIASLALLAGNDGNRWVFSVIELFKTAPFIKPEFYISFFVLSYLSGSIPFGLLFTKLFGYGDIRKIGSGNIGATNALRTGNKWLAGLTLLCDALKGFVPCTVFSLYIKASLLLVGETKGLSPYPNDTLQEYLSILLCISGLCAILGHVFPLWLKFKGGKGVATAIGTLFAITPLTAFFLLLIWLAMFALTRASSLSALSAFAGATLIAAFTGKVVFMYMLIVTLLIFATHRSNIARLIKGTEPKIGKKNESA